LISGLSLGAASAPDSSEEIDEANLGGGLAARSAANARGAVDERQFVILLQKDHHAVGELDALGLLGMECRKSGHGDLLPVRDLCRGLWDRHEQRGGENRCESNRLEVHFEVHRVPPESAAP